MISFSSFSFGASSSLVRSLLHYSSTSSSTGAASRCKNLCRLPPYLRFFSSRAYDRLADPFTVSYLIEKCGLSKQDAQSAAKSISFISPANATPDSVLEFLRDHSFSPAQISHVIKKFPQVLSFSSEKTLSPKLDFLKSKGFSSSELPKLIYGNPWILGRSLEGHIVPSFDLISSLIGSEKKTMAAIRRYPSLLVIDPKAEIVPKVNLFVEHGIPEKNFGFFLSSQPRHIKNSIDWFKDIIDRVKKIGISPSQVKFVMAVQVFGQLSQSTWDRKLEVFSRWGWSEEMTLRAFSKYPWCMQLSESKIMAAMDYFTKEMGLQSSYISEFPLLLYLSLAKRIVPRYSVIKALRSRGLIGELNYRVAMCISEEKFLEKYVARFPSESDHLLNLYHEKMGSKETD